MKEKCIPIVKIDKIEDVGEIFCALNYSGYNKVEIVARTECCFEAIKKVNELFNNFIVGAGTILNKKQCEQAIKSGAKFIVSPGFSKSIAKTCLKYNIEYIPGCLTSTEIMEAMNYNVKTIKFFPAKIFGGVDYLKLLAGPFPNITFIPTGNITEDDVDIYLAIENVSAVGSSFFLKKALSEYKNIK